MAAVKCWRCDRKLAETEGSGNCAIVVTCPRCNAKVRIEFRAESSKQGLDKLTSSGIMRVVK